MWTVRSENRKGHSKKFYQSRTRTSRSSGSREVNHHMKGIAGPMLKSLGNGGDPEVEDTGLLDGGATRPLRQGTSDEIKNAVQVTVELAHGAAQLYQIP